MIPELLRTINVPKNMAHLTENLPKANYVPLKYRVSSVNTRSLASSMEKIPQEGYNMSILVVIQVQL